jgi:hypothetical protein
MIEAFETTFQPKTSVQKKNPEPYDSGFRAFNFPSGFEWLDNAAKPNFPTSGKDQVRGSQPKGASKMNISSYVNLYLSLTNKRKKIIQFLFFYFQKYKLIFPKQSSILEYADCSDECLKKFHRANADCDNLFFKVKKRYDPSGRQTTNIYEFDPDFLKALIWLDTYDYLKSPKTKYATIRSRIENEEKVAPPPLQKLPPILEIKIRREESLKRAKFGSGEIHPMIEKVKIPFEAKVMLSKYPEFAIVQAIEKAVYWTRQGEKIRDPVNYLLFKINKALNRNRCNL